MTLAPSPPCHLGQRVVDLHVVMALDPAPSLRVLLGVGAAASFSRIDEGKPKLTLRRSVSEEEKAMCRHSDLQEGSTSRKGSLQGSLGTAPDI